MTVVQNVAYGLRVEKVGKAETVHKIGAAIELVRLAGRETRSVVELSGGQEERVALARALIMRHEVLLLDEPPTELDLKSRKQRRTKGRRMKGKVDLDIVLLFLDSGLDRNVACVVRPENITIASSADQPDISE